MACDPTKPGWDLLRAFKDLSPHTRQPGLFPSADSPTKREAAPAGCCQREETGLEKNPARAVGFGQETNRAQEKQPQLSEGLFHSWRDNPLPLSSFSPLFFFLQSLLLADQAELVPRQAAALSPSLILEHPGHASAAQSCSWGHRHREHLTPALLHPNHKPFLPSSTLARRMRQRARPWRYFAAIGTASPSPAFFSFCCARGSNKFSFFPLFFSQQ